MGAASNDVTWKGETQHAEGGTWKDKRDSVLIATHPPPETAAPSALWRRLGRTIQLPNGWPDSM